jgi:murein L,D-transpeptidase YcbB/YkuD
LRIGRIHTAGFIHEVPGAMSSYQRAAAAFAVFVSCTLIPVAGDVDAASPAVTSPEIAEELRGFLAAQGSPHFVEDDRAAELWKAVQTFYRDRGYAPVWIDAEGLTPGGQALVRTISAAGGEGLPVERYDPRLLVGQAPHVIPAAVGETPADRRAKLDVALTWAFLRYAADVTSGTVDPRGSTSLWRSTPQGIDAAALLDQAVREDAPARVLEAARPAHPQYAALSDALVRYRRLASAGGWPMLPAGARLRPGRPSPHTAALRARLQASGDFGGVGMGHVYDTPLVKAVKVFERRHGLKADGIVDEATLAALNVPVEDRIRQIELNLERWRWQDWSPEGRSILVNVPTFELHAYDGGRQALTMRVVAGKGDSPTPVFAETMQHVVFSPHWNVPPNILETEILPAVRRNPGYLARHNMEMVRTESGGLAVRQRPGPGNSLGLVKFLFPNPFHVYLHDTPQDSLFTRDRRAFSHGCVRVEKPEALARFVLRGTDWDDASIARAMRSGRERFVALEEEIPVTIAYFTAWVDPDGTVRFGPDVYRHDVAQAGLLPPPRPVTLVAASRS